jgi:hypothetical protein
MSKAIPVNNDNFRYIFRAKLWLNVQADIEKLMEQIDEMNYRPDVIFVDPLYTAVKGSLSNDEVASGIICSIRMLQERYNCCVVVVHHEHKAIRDREGNRINEGDDSIMGSSLFKNFANHVLRLTFDKKTKMRELTCDTQRNSKVLNKVKLVLNEDPLGFHIEHKSTPPMQLNILNYLKIHGQSCTVDICSGTGIACQSSASNAITKLHKEGKVKKLKKGMKTYWEVVE